VTPQPQELVSRLRRKGFDASRATSNIAPVPAPPGLPHLAPEEAARMMSGLVFLPVYPELPEETLDELSNALEEAADLAPASRA
jgi:perosamine synthetase